MSSNFNSTEIEQQILNEARQLLGPNLANYLFSGLGETNVIRWRAFTAQSDSSYAEDISYRFEMRNESGQKGLPIGRDPLVLAALIGLLQERQPQDSRVTFKDRDILENLRWPLAPESLTLIRQPLERYFFTAYYLIDLLLPTFRRLLIGYETTSVLLPMKRTTQQRLTRVQFLPEFSHDIFLE